MGEKNDYLGVMTITSNILLITIIVMCISGFIIARLPVQSNDYVAITATLPVFSNDYVSNHSVCEILRFHEIVFTVRNTREKTQ